MTRKIEQILDGLRAGQTRTAVLAQAGIPAASLAYWIDKSKKVAEAVEQAEDQGEALHAAVIHKAATGCDTKKKITTTKSDGSHETRIEEETKFDWRASKYWLEVRHRREWGKALPAESTPAASNKFYLTLIKMVQNQGITSSEGQELFQDEDSDALPR